MFPVSNSATATIFFSLRETFLGIIHLVPAQILPYQMANMFVFRTFLHTPEAVTRKCSVKKVFLNISQNSQENTCARV